MIQLSLLDGSYEPMPPMDLAVQFLAGCKPAGLIHRRLDGAGRTVCGLAMPANPGGGWKAMGAFSKAGRAADNEVCGECGRAIC